MGLIHTDVFTFRLSVTLWSCILCWFRILGPPSAPDKTHMSALPLSARLYVGATIAIGATLVVLLGPRSDFDNIPLFVVLLLTSAITSAFKVSLPLAKSGSTMSVSYAVDFASLLLLGPNE